METVRKEKLAGAAPLWQRVAAESRAKKRQHGSSEPKATMADDDVAS